MSTNGLGTGHREEGIAQSFRVPVDSLSCLHRILHERVGYASAYHHNEAVVEGLTVLVRGTQMPVHVYTQLYTSHLTHNSLHITPNTLHIIP